jgi:hypothetical protein
MDYVGMTDSVKVKSSSEDITHEFSPLLAFLSFPQLILARKFLPHAGDASPSRASPAIQI